MVLRYRASARAPLIMAKIIDDQTLNHNDQHLVISTAYNSGKQVRVNPQVK